MVTFFLVVLGGLMGAAADELNGCIVGAMIGYLVARAIQDSSQRKKLELRVGALEIHIASLRSERPMQGVPQQPAAGPVITPTPPIPPTLPAVMPTTRPVSEDDIPMSERKTVELPAALPMTGGSRAAMPMAEAVISTT